MIGALLILQIDFDAINAPLLHSSTSPIPKRLFRLLTPSFSSSPAGRSVINLLGTHAHALHQDKKEPKEVLLSYRAIPTHLRFNQIVLIFTRS